MNRIFTQLFLFVALMVWGNFAASAATNYGIYVGETMITSDNASDVLKNGQFSYSPQTKTLTVTNADLTNEGTLGSGISNREVDGLIIKFVGHSTFNTRMNVINTAKSISLTGTGSLTGSAGETCALYLWGDDITCTVNGPVIDLSSQADALRDSHQNATLRVEGSTTSLSLQGSGYHKTVNGLGSLSLGLWAEITEPFLSRFDEEQHTICNYQSTTPYKGKVTIGASYPLYVADVQVTPLNASNITGEGITGNVSYDASTKTLRLINASLLSKIGNGIQNRGVDMLKIEVLGVNKIDCTGDGLALILAQQEMSLTGNGILQLMTDNRNYCIRNLSGYSFTIDGPTVMGSTRTEAYDGNKKGDLIVKGRSQLLLIAYDGIGVIKDVPNLVLGSGLYITEPYGGYFSPTLQSITTDGVNPHKGILNISIQEPKLKYGIIIGETDVTEDNAADIFDDGQFSYDPQTKTLTVNNANLVNNGALGPGISNREVDGLIVNLVGDNFITGRNFAFITSKRATITGSGSLKLTATEGNGIHLGDGCDLLTIDGPTIEVTGNDAGLFDDSGGATLWLKGRDTKLILNTSTNAIFPTIYSLKDLKLDDGLGISKPAGGYFSPEMRTVTVDGTSAYRGDIVINAMEEQPDPADVNGDGSIDVADISMVIDIMAGKVETTSDNQGDVNGDGIVDVADISSIISAMAEK
ncbi:MAG: dockerin type I repeat-containing protein [Prevotella sp.]|nr:dockerin type I repeat-containing protein [Prevotella sp.]